MKKNNNTLRLFFFVIFFFLIFLKSTFAVEDYKQSFQRIINYLFQIENPVYWIIYVILFIIFFYFFWQAISSASPFSDHVSFIISLGLVIMLSLTKGIGKISSFLYDSFYFYRGQGWFYTILFLIGILVVLLLFKHVFGWSFYLFGKSRKKERELKKELKRLEKEALLEGISKGIK